MVKYLYLPAYILYKKRVNGISMLNLTQATVKVIHSLVYIALQYTVEHLLYEVH